MKLLFLSTISKKNFNVIIYFLSEPSVPRGANNIEEEETNRKAIMVLNIVKDKLTGKDFGNTDPIDEVTQIDHLIKQATSSENLCQCFIGWCAWW